MNILRTRHIPLSYNSKIPLKGSRYKTQQYYTDEELYNHNIGIRTGNGLCVLDLDKQDIINKWLQQHTILGITLPDTYTVKTRKGYHLYYWYSTNVTLPTRLNYNNQGIDIKSGINGYVVGAGSIVQGVKYVQNDKEIQQLPIEFLKRIHKDDNTRLIKQQQTIREVLSLLEMI